MNKIEEKIKKIVRSEKNRKLIMEIIEEYLEAAFDAAGEGTAVCGDWEDTYSFFSEWYKDEVDK
jgi:hypothetical protein